MSEEVTIVVYLLASSVSVAALELNSIHLIKLAIRAAEGAVIRILCKPMTLAIRADGLLTDLAL